MPLIKANEWSIIRFIIGDEIDAMFGRLATDQKMGEDDKIEVSKQDLNDMYFEIRERVERNVKIEEADAENIIVKRNS